MPVDSETGEDVDEEEEIDEVNFSKPSPPEMTRILDEDDDDEEEANEDVDDDVDAACMFELHDENGGESC